FVGSHLADAIVPHADVVIVDHLRTGKRANVAGALKAGARLVRRDVLRGDLRPIFRRADVVYHFAANPEVRLGKAGTKSHLEDNIIATHRVLEACRTAKVPRIVFTSTSTVYGEPTRVPTPEDYGALEPNSRSGAAQRASEARGAAPP